MSETPNRQTIDQLSRQVPEGGSKLFQRRSTDPGAERFVEVWQNWDYRPGRLKWRNKPSMEEAPWYGSRQQSGRSLSDIPTPDVTFKGRAKDVVDFYSTGCDAFLVSEKLVALIESMDPNSLGCVPVLVKCSDADLPFHMAMPAHRLTAVDLDCTSILVEDEWLGDMWFRRIRFPEGVCFREPDLKNIHTFADLDAPGWYWSRDLIDAAKAADVRGLRTVSPRATYASRVDLDRL
jgi:hypothetical protein